MKPSCSLILASVCFLLLLGCSGSRTLGGLVSVQRPLDRSADSHRVKENTATTTTGCPLVSGAACPHPTPDRSPTPVPSPTPIVTNISHSTRFAPSDFKYIVTTGQKSYYFPRGSVATFNSNHNSLVVRGFLNIFAWRGSVVNSLIVNGVGTPPVSLPSEPDSPLFAISTHLQRFTSGQDQGCDVSQQDCAPCPDCEGPPGNPNSCSYGTDPISGRCIGQNQNLFISFDFFNGASYCVPNQSQYAACFTYNFSILPLRAGCTSDFVFHIQQEFTVYSCGDQQNPLPATALFFTGQYYEIDGIDEIRTSQDADPINPGSGRVNWTVSPTYTSIAGASSQILDQNKHAINGGYAMYARVVSP